jgi:hypothetical protein
MSEYRLFVNDERTILVRLWSNDQAEMATRETSSHTWGPPVSLVEEKVGGFTSRIERERAEFDRALAEARRHSEPGSNAAPSPGALAASERTRKD